MLDYIKNQAESDEAEASVIGPVLILALVLAAIVLIFGRLMESTERKGSDIANCIANVTNFSGAEIPKKGACDNKNSEGRKYDTAGESFSNKK